jgi:hypothetical protein
LPGNRAEGVERGKKEPDNKEGQHHEESTEKKNSHGYFRISLHFLS